LFATPRRCGVSLASKIDDADMKEAVTEAHAIGDDAFGHSNAANYTHGSSAQCIRWFRRGFDSGDPRQCDTFAVGQLGAKASPRE
jgi:predicted metalloprotease